MSVVAAAIIGSAVVGAGATYLSSKSAAKGVQSGIDSEERIADKNLALQKELADTQREDFAPWRDVGQMALDQIWQGTQDGSFEVGDINLEDDPGYKVRMAEGVGALDASAAARGRLLSGAQQKQLTRYGQEQGSKEYGNAYARELNKKKMKYNILSNLSAGGQASAAGQAQTTGQLAMTSGNIMSNLGRSQNVAAQNKGNIRAGAYQDYGKTLNKAASNWLTYSGAGA